MPSGRVTIGIVLPPAGDVKATLKGHISRRHRVAGQNRRVRIRAIKLERAVAGSWGLLVDELNARMARLEERPVMNPRQASSNHSASP